jgi:hypothetical protein
MILRRAPARMRGSSSRQAPRLRDRWCPGGRYGQPLFCARHRRAFFMACGRRGARVGATAQRALPPSTAPASMHGTAMRITIAVGSGRSCSRQARRRSGISGVCWPRLNPASWSCCAGAPPAVPCGGGAIGVALAGGGGKGRSASRLAGSGGGDRLASKKHPPH